LNFDDLAIAWLMVACSAQPGSSPGENQTPSARLLARVPMAACTIKGEYPVQAQTSALCGTLRVPEDRSNPDGRQIGLRVAVVNPVTRILGETRGARISASNAPDGGSRGGQAGRRNGVIDPNMRRSPSAVRSLFMGLGAERLPFHASWLGERVLDVALYDHETHCDWTVGSFILARKEAVDDPGDMDERFFLYCEETDICLRMRQEDGTSSIFLR
jgi:hypothetical protein